MEQGYVKGFEVKIITHEAWELEVQIMSRVLEVIGLKVKLDVLKGNLCDRQTLVGAGEGRSRIGCWGQNG